LAGTINALAFSPDGQHLAAAGGYKGKGEIKIWDRTLWDDQSDKRQDVKKDAMREKR